MITDRTIVSTASVARAPLAAEVKLQVLIEALTAAVVVGMTAVHALMGMTGCRLSENELMSARAAKEVMVDVNSMLATCLRISRRMQLTWSSAPMAESWTSM